MVPLRLSSLTEACLSVAEPSMSKTEVRPANTWPSGNSSLGNCPNWVVVLPSLGINGGVREALEIAAGLRVGQKGRPVQIISMWHARHEFAQDRKSVV